MSEGFLGRWSRRKQEVRAAEAAVEAKTVPEPVPAPMQATEPPPLPQALPPHASPASENEPEKAPPLTLVDVEGLGVESDYKPFLAKEVAPEVKNAAFRKLFSDPHFNVMDGLDTYIDDYSQPDPIPPEMLRELRHTAGLRLFEPLEDEAAAPTGIEPVSDPSPASPAVTGEMPREPADAESPLPDGPAQATPHGGAKPPSVE